MKAAAFLLILFCAMGTQAGAGEMPARQILGLRLGMTEKEAHARLKEIGQFVRQESHEQEVWKISDPSFSHILIGFAKEEKLRYITAVARKDKEAKPVSYREIGNLEKARQVGDAKIKVFNYQWTLPPENDEPETLVIALGRNPERLDTWALRRLGEKGSEEKD